MQPELSVRPVRAEDAARCAGIYAHYVSETAISFETDPPTVEEMAVRIAAIVESHAWFVLCDVGRVVGYAFGHAFAPRAAYRWACETSVYIDSSHTGRGGGRALYTALLACLGERGYRQAMAGMTLPNEASAALHRAVGFELVGVYRRVGWKHGRWHDVARLQKSISDDADPPAEPS